MERGPTRIDITYGAVPNGRTGHGWIPQVTEDGNTRTHDWLSTGYDKDVALEMAREIANETAARFVGDWDVRITELQDKRTGKPTEGIQTTMRKQISSRKAAPAHNGHRATLTSIRTRHKHELTQLRSAHQLEVLALRDRHRSERELLKARHKRELVRAQTATALLRRAKRKPKP